MNKNSAPKFAFYYLLSLVALIFMTISTGMIFFQVINKYLPDLFGNYGADFSSGALKFAISAIIISSPIFYIVTRFICRHLYKGTLDKDAGIRRWLSYFILFVSAVIIIVSLIMTINSYLNGELTNKFIWKMVVVVALSAIVFSFYLYDIKREKVIGIKDKVFKIYFWASLAIVLSAFVYSLTIVESPKETRNRRVDDQIVSNFYSLESGINSYYDKHKVLPPSLDLVKAEVSYLNSDAMLDPVSKEALVYEISGTSTYKLCATFRTSNMDKNREEFRYVEDNKRHEAGYGCLDFRLYDYSIK